MAWQATERISGCRNSTCAPIAARPPRSAEAAASGSMPSCRAARHNSACEAAGSAAATASSNRVSSGRRPTRRPNASSSDPPICSGSGSSSAPASWAGDSSLATSTSASGFPPVSATIRTATAGLSRPGASDASKSSAAWSSSPPIASSGSPASSGSGSAGSRTANSSTTCSANRRRATKPSTIADSGSSHCTSSITPTSGAAVATSGSPTQRPGRVAGCVRHAGSVYLTFGSHERAAAVSWRTGRSWAADGR
jgi:hypothetical protein